MSDIFISYAQRDHAKVAFLVKVLEQRGWSVFWNRKIPIGKTWDQVLEVQLPLTRCVIVLWSSASIVSKWVRIEARKAEQRGILMPALLDNIHIDDIPLEFSSLQTLKPCARI